MNLSKTSRVLFFFTIFMLAGVLESWSKSDGANLKFDFGAGKVEPGYV
jgi:hypothetical protein